MPGKDISLFLEETGPVLCLDIGSGTQDAVLARPGLQPENWAHMVLPAPARMVARRVRELTLLRKNVWLYGGNMGGGFAGALKHHMAEGFSVAISHAAAFALHDNMAVVRGMGVELADSCPAGFVPVHIADYSPAFWENLLAVIGLPQPHLTVVAAQDHGFHEKGNREARMVTWKKLLQKSGNPAEWIYDAAPKSLTRLATVQAASGGPVADTGTSAILGALCQPEVMDRSFREGITVINAGNGHTVAALVYRARVLGIYEHHTGMRTVEELAADLKEFRLGWKPDEEVRASGGHGTAFTDIPGEAGSFAPTYILGPRRGDLTGFGQFIAPFGNMMTAGCSGLLKGLATRHAEEQSIGRQPGK